MADTYRPLREDDPVGTEVYTQPFSISSGRITTRRGQQACVDDGAFLTVWHVSKLFVRVPDPWGELLEAAKWAEKELAGCRVSNIHMYNQLGVSIAAVEAHQAQAKAVTHG